MNNNKIAKALVKATKMAEDNAEGHIIVQLAPNNRMLLVTHQYGNSWESMGLTPNESQDRIILDLDCREHSPMYWDDDNNRMDAMDQDWETFHDMVNEMAKDIIRIIGRQKI